MLQFESAKTTAKIEAVDFNNATFGEICKVASIKTLPNGVIEHYHLDEVGNLVDVSDRIALMIDTPTGKQLIIEKDMLLRDSSGALIVCKPDVFKAAYQTVRAIKEVL